MTAEADMVRELAGAGAAGSLGGGATSINPSATTTQGIDIANRISQAFGGKTSGGGADVHFGGSIPWVTIAMVVGVGVGVYLLLKRK